MRNSKTVLASVIAIVLLSIALINGCKKEENKNLPTACFSQSATTVLGGVGVDFTNCSTGGLTYVWNFGDGQTSDQFSPTHAYSASGTYTVTLSVTNADGSVDKTSTVTVTSSASAIYAGSYSVSDICANGNMQYTATITSTGPSSINISGFGKWLTSCTVNATVSGNTLTIPSQTANCGIQFNGTGTLSANHNTLTISYHGAYGASGATDDCVSTYTRQ